MDVQIKNNYTFVSVNAYSFEKFKLEWEALTSNHLVLEISENLNIDDAIISLLLIIAEDLNQKGMSFVTIKPSINIDDFPENINIVPTLQEAEDMIEMESIERDLGF